MLFTPDFPKSDKFDDAFNEYLRQNVLHPDSLDEDRAWERYVEVSFEEVMA